MSIQWPSPRPLENVKSKKRAIFELKDAVLKTTDGEFKVESASLTLESRVAAIGRAGQALADVLLRLQTPVSGSVSQHDHLTVLHLGPHLADAAAIVAALEVRPHVLVLSESGEGNSAWAQMFEKVVHSHEFQNFQGALVVCVSQEDRLPPHLCSTRWVASEGCLLTESVSIGATMLENLCGKENSDASYSPLRAQVSQLAATFFDDSEEGGDDSISAVAAQHGWTVDALVTTDSSGKRELVGYVTYNAEPALGALCLQRVAILPKYRRRGYATQLVRWTIERARTEGYESLWVHAVPKLQTINKAIGFSYINPAEETIPDDEKKSAWMMIESGCKREAASLPNRTGSKKARKQKRR